MAKLSVCDSTVYDVDGIADAVALLNIIVTHDYDDSRAATCRAQIEQWQSEDEHPEAFAAVLAFLDAAKAGETPAQPGRPVDPHIGLQHQGVYLLDPFAELAKDKPSCQIQAVTYGMGSDKHLAAVLVKRGNGELVSWLFHRQTGGFMNGTYGDSAQACYEERARRVAGLR